MDNQPYALKASIYKIFFSFLLAFLSVASILAIFMAKSAVALVLVGFIGLLVSLYLSGNPRVFCLWGLILSAPLSLSKKFHPIAHMGGAGSYNLELIDIFLIGLMYFIFRDFRWGHIKRFRISRASYYWGGMIFLGVITVVGGPFRHLASQEVFQMSKHLLIYLVLINELVRIKQFFHALGALVVGVFIESVVGIIQFVFKTDLHLQALGEATLETIQEVTRVTFMEAGGGFRIGALIGHPNLLSAYLALILPICIAALFGKLTGRYKAGIVITVVLGVTTLILTLSRAGWIAFALAFIVLVGMSFYHFKMRRRFLFTRVILIGAVFIMGVVFSGPILKRITESDPGALDFRQEWNQMAWQMIQDKPVLGFGLNSFVFQMVPYSKYKTLEKMQDKIGKVLPVVHNIYLLIWTEQGTFGFLLFLGLNFHVLWMGMRNAKFFEERLLFMMNLGCLSGFIAIMADGMGSFFLRNPQCGRMYWIVIALITAINYWYKENQMRPKNPSQIKTATPNSKSARSLKKPDEEVVAAYYEKLTL